MQTVATYSLAAPVRPQMNFDNGFLDQNARRAPTLGDHAMRKFWQAAVIAVETAQGVPFVPHNDIPDALAAYRHFLYGKGRTRTLSYERYVANDASGKRTLRACIQEVKKAVFLIYMSRPAGQRASFAFTGTAIAAGGKDHRFPYPETENWQKAIGAHYLWISGNAAVTETVADPLFTVDFTIHMEDRYNFNPGQQDIATSVPDAWNGQLSVSGLGHQYNNVAELSRKVTWSGSPGGSVHEVEGAPWLRQRMPSGNRRLRNRL